MSLSSLEFSSLRQTIAARGTARMLLFAITLFVWASLALAVLLFAKTPLAALFPLAVLVGGFEAIHALSSGVERIGRYLQVYYEAADTGARWETVAMAVGPALPGGGVDPLFTVVFASATALDLLPLLLLPPTSLELALVSLPHLAFLVRMIRARVAAARQRAVELESVRAMRMKENGR